LTTRAEVWKRALAMLGSVCYRGGAYEEACKRLGEAEQRGLDLPGMACGKWAVKFCLAESLRLATWETTVERKARLEKAAGCYEGFLAGTEGADESGMVTELRRNARFARADVLFELGKYEEAAKAYREFSELYARSGEAVTALYRLAMSLERSGQTAEAGQARELAKWSAEQLKKQGEKKPEKVLTSYWQAVDAWE